MQTSQETQSTPNQFAPSIIHAGTAFGVNPRKESNDYKLAANQLLEKIKNEGGKATDKTIFLHGDWQDNNSNAAVNELINSGVNIRSTQPLNPSFKERLDAADELRKKFNNGGLTPENGSFADLLNEQLAAKKKQAATATAATTPSPQPTAPLGPEADAAPTAPQKPAAPVTAPPATAPTAPSATADTTPAATTEPATTERLTVESPRTAKNVTIPPKEFFVKETTPTGYNNTVDSCLQHIEDLKTTKGVDITQLNVTVNGAWKGGDAALEKLIASGVEVSFGAGYKPSEKIQKLQTAAQEVRAERDQMVAEGKTPTESFETTLRKKTGGADSSSLTASQQATGTSANNTSNSGTATSTTPTSGQKETTSPTAKDLNSASPKGMASWAKDSIKANSEKDYQTGVGGPTKTV